MPPNLNRGFMEYLLVFIKKRLTQTTTYIACLGLVMLILGLESLMFWFFIGLFVLPDETANEIAMKIDNWVKKYIK